ncbi:hypothetical protein HDU84_007722 [Entophlyctis sp. JEL0112]|nr:hypothetical protein HDU84_007722 [Entophlyctis sp. JEL0112]
MLGIAVLKADAEPSDMPPAPKGYQTVVSAVDSTQMRQMETARSASIWLWGGGATTGESKTKSAPQKILEVSDQPLRHLALSPARMIAAIDLKGTLLLYSPNLSNAAVPILESPELVFCEFSKNALLALSKSGIVYKIDLSKLVPVIERLKSNFVDQKPKTLSLFQSLVMTGVAVDASAVEKLPAPERILSISTGESHVLALSESGKAYSLALNEEGNKSGQLGFQAEAISREFKPVAFPAALGGSRIAQLCAGSAFSLARTTDGRVFSWGDNRYGQLGTAKRVGVDIASRSVPAEVVIPNTSSGGGKCLQIACGKDTAVMVVDSDHTTLVYSFGMGQWGQLGNGKFMHVCNTPQKIMELSELREYNEAKNTVVPIRIASLAMSASATHALAVLDISASSGAQSAFGRDVFAWGSNESGQLARADGKASNSAVPVWVTPVTISGAKELPSDEKELAEESGKRLEWNPKSYGRLQVAGPGKIPLHPSKSVWFGSSMAVVEQAFAVADGVTALYSRVV